MPHFLARAVVMATAVSSGALVAAPAHAAAGCNTPYESPTTTCTKAGTDSYAVPAEAKTVTITAVGAGGGGGGSSALGIKGGGAGAGSTVRCTLSGLAGKTLTIQVGAAGQRGGRGSDSGDSSAGSPGSGGTGNDPGESGSAGGITGGGGGGGGASTVTFGTVNNASYEGWLVIRATGGGGGAGTGGSGHGGRGGGYIDNHGIARDIGGPGGAGKSKHGEGPTGGGGGRSSRCKASSADFFVDSVRSDRGQNGGQANPFDAALRPGNGPQGGDTAAPNECGTQRSGGVSDKTGNDGCIVITYTT